jgi:hypothetical protein
MVPLQHGKVERQAQKNVSKRIIRGPFEIKADIRRGLWKRVCTCKSLPEFTSVKKK